MSTVYSQDHLASSDELYTAKEYSNAFINPADDPTLPNVLLIGDSISIGYTVTVRKQLKGKADVFRIATNGRHSAYGLKHLNKWLGSKKWHVIHFNWGLWDLAYRNPQSKNQGHRDKINGTLTATASQYKQTMTAIIKKLTATGSRLIWATTTPIPPLELGRKEGDEIRYNQIVQDIVAPHNIAINDLHAHVLRRWSEIQIKPGDVHFTQAGYEYLGQKVALAIKQSLPRKWLIQPAT